MLTWLGLARYQSDTLASAIGRFLLDREAHGRALAGSALV